MASCLFPSACSSCANHAPPLSFHDPHGQKSTQPLSCTHSLTHRLALLSLFIVLSPVGVVSPAKVSTAEARPSLPSAPSSLSWRDELTVNRGLVLGIRNLFDALSISPHRLPPDRFSKVSDRDPRVEALTASNMPSRRRTRFSAASDAG